MGPKIQGPLNSHAQVSSKAGAGDTAGTKSSLTRRFQQFVSVEENGVKMFNSLKISKKKKSGSGSKSSQDELISFIWQKYMKGQQV